jgi:hypothetical protein
VAAALGVQFVLAAVVAKDAVAVPRAAVAVALQRVVVAQGAAQPARDAPAEHAVGWQSAQHAAVLRGPSAVAPFVAAVAPHRRQPGDEPVRGAEALAPRLVTAVQDERLLVRQGGPVHLGGLALRVLRRPAGGSAPLLAASRGGVPARHPVERLQGPWGVQAQPPHWALRRDWAGWPPAPRRRQDADQGRTPERRRVVRPGGRRQG